MAAATVSVSRKGAERIQRGHPWVFRTDVAHAEGVAPGALVRVADPRGRPLGFAFFSSRSEIRLRMVSRQPELAEGFLRDRLADAVRWRETVAPEAQACRLVHGEGDGLPSVIVDRYGEFLVVQTLSQAAERLKGEIVAALVELLRPRGILERNDPRVRLLEGLEQTVALLHGDVPELVHVDEAGVRFEVDLWRGQKTGLFLDQRENHLMARGYARGRVLDAFSYHGGFALSAAQTATSVTAIDVSEDAVSRLRRNAERNGFTNVEAR